MKTTDLKDTSPDFLDVYTSDTGDISFGVSTKTAETKKKKNRVCTGERINEKKFTWH